MCWVIVGSGGERGVMTACTGPVRRCSRCNLTGLLIHSSSKQCWPMATGEEQDREDGEEGGWQTVSSSKKRKERERIAFTGHSGETEKGGR